MRIAQVGQRGTFHQQRRNSCSVERCQDPLDLTTADELGERLCARCLSQPIVDLQRPTRNGLGLMELQSMSQ